MKRKVRVLCLLAGCVAVCCSGCTKHLVIKQDESLAAAAASTGAEVRKQQEQFVTTAAGLTAKGGVTVPGAAGPKAASGEAIAFEELKNSLESISFNVDSAQLSEESRGSLVRNSELIQIIGNSNIRVEGNCDERGSDEYNLALGDKRARQAVQYLVSLGIPTNRLTSVSYGKEKPVDPGHDETSWAKNRRDDFVVLP